MFVLVALVVAEAKLAEPKLSDRISSLKNKIQMQRKRIDPTITAEESAFAGRIKELESAESTVVFDSHTIDHYFIEIKSTLLGVTGGPSISITDKAMANSERSVPTQNGRVNMSGITGNATFRVSHPVQTVPNKVVFPTSDETCSIKRGVLYGLIDEVYQRIGAEFELPKRSVGFHEVKVECRSAIRAWRVEILENWGDSQTCFLGARMFARSN